jgi:hypothetical protein
MHTPKAAMASYEALVLEIQVAQDYAMDHSYDLVVYEVQAHDSLPYSIQYFELELQTD